MAAQKVGLDDALAAGMTLVDLERLIVDALPPITSEKNGTGSVAPIELISPKAAATDVKPSMHQAAYHGLAGDVVRAIAPTTEADPVALLVTFLTMFGNACGRSPHVLVGDARHGANLFTVLVGETGRSRKGTSQDGPLRLMTIADAEWVKDRVQGGMSTGEGLLWAVRDEMQRLDKRSGKMVTDPGVADKRLLCIEEELSQVLKTAQRPGATVTEIIRRAWDARRTIQTLTKESPGKATNAHISILGHITKAELLQQITETDLANGFANRFAWFRVHRAQLLPNPEPLADDVAAALAARIARALAFAREVGTVTRDAETLELWAVAYGEMEQDRPGLASAITARAAPIVLRLSLIYALLDESRMIWPQHLKAALAVWDYAEASVRSIFGDLTGDAVADRILEMLRTDGPMARDEIRNAFHRNQSAAGRIGPALKMLHQAGQIIAWKEPSASGKGRHRTMYAFAGTLAS